MRYTVLVPVKALALAKSRLAPYLTEGQRATFVLDMLSHVLRVARAAEEIEQTAVVSADRRVLALAQQLGAIPLLEQRAGHNPALRAAAATLQQHGAQALLILSADLPLLAPCDITAMVEQAAHYEVVLAPSREKTGTNALLVRPPLAIPYRFGPNSRERHLQAARNGSLNSVLYQSRGTAFDIDTIDDVLELEQICHEWREQPEMAV